MTKGERLSRLLDSGERALQVGFFALQDIVVEPIAERLPPGVGRLLSRSVRLKKVSKGWIHTRHGREKITQF